MFKVGYNEALNISMDRAVDKTALRQCEIFLRIKNKYLQPHRVDSQEFRIWLLCTIQKLSS